MTKRKVGSQPRWKKCSVVGCKNRHPTPKSDSAIDMGWATMESDITKWGSEKQELKIQIYACPDHSKHIVNMFRNALVGQPIKTTYEEPIPDWLKVAAGGRK